MDVNDGKEAATERKKTDKVKEKPRNMTRAPNKPAIKRRSAEEEAVPGDKEDDWREQFECPVCLEEMKPPARIHQCVDGHLLCGLCRENPAIVTCPVCRGNIMGRAVVMEKLAKALFGGDK